MNKKKPKNKADTPKFHSNSSQKKGKSLIVAQDTK